MLLPSNLLVDSAVPSPLCFPFTIEECSAHCCSFNIRECPPQCYSFNIRGHSPPLGGTPLLHSFDTSIKLTSSCNSSNLLLTETMLVHLSSCELTSGGNCLVLPTTYHSSHFSPRSTFFSLSLHTCSRPAFPCK